MGNFTRNGTEFFLYYMLDDGISVDWATGSPMAEWPNFKYLGLMKTGTSGGYVEITGTGYERKKPTSWNVDTTATPCKVTNGAAISWTGAADWMGPITGIGLFVYDHQNNYELYLPLTNTPVGAVAVAPIPDTTLGAGMVLTIAVGQLTFFYD